MVGSLLWTYRIDGKEKTMSCKAAKFDLDEGRYYCDVSGDQCMYYIPNSKKCAEEYGEGPDAYCEEDEEEG